MNETRVNVVTESGKALALSCDGSVEVLEIEYHGVDRADDRKVRFLMTAYSTNAGAYLSVRGEVIVLGRNDFGMLGVPGATTYDYLQPTILPPSCFGDENIMQVAMGTHHLLVLTESGKVYSVGDGSYGRLGHGSALNVKTFKLIASLAGMVATFVAAGSMMSAVVIGGKIYVFGNGRRGELGIGGTGGRLLPTLVTMPSESPVSLVTVGRYHTASVDANGELFTWGNNSHGQLGLGNKASRLTPTLATCEDKRVVTASCGAKHTLAVTGDGGVYMCGLELMTVAGQTATTLFKKLCMPPAVSVSTSGMECFTAVTTEGQLYTWNTTSVPTPFHLQERVDQYNHRMDTGHILAFAMILHWRLGGQSGLRDLPEEIVRRVLGKTVSWPAGPVGALEGVARLLGGGAVTVAATPTHIHTL